MDFKDLSYFDSFLVRKTSTLHIWAYDKEMNLLHFKEHWKPHHFVRASKKEAVNTHLRSLEGYPLRKVEYNNLFEMNNELKDLTENEKLVVKENGFVPPEIPKIAELFPQKPETSIKPKRLYFDIEVFSEKGFPTPDRGVWPITSCAFYREWESKMVCYGIKPLTDKEQEALPDECTFIYCEDEISLIVSIIRC